MTKQKVKSIIFDYGGVFTNGSRSAFVSTKLSRTKAEQRALADFFSSAFVRQCARGEHDSSDLIEAIRAIVNRRTAHEISEVLNESCLADQQMLKLVQALKPNHNIYLISDSLPPYTAFITTHYRAHFDALFMSDVLRLRKSEGLYQEAEKEEAGLFESSVYIDDRESNVIGLPHKSMTGIVFNSHAQCANELKMLGIM